MTRDATAGTGNTPRRLAPGALALAAASGLLAILVTGEAAPPLPAPVERAQSSITEGDLRAAVTLLASDALAGRGTGHPGNDVAARYVAAMLEAADLSPLDASGFLQPLDVFTPTSIDARLTLQDGEGHSPETHEVGDHFQPLGQSPDAEATGAIAFAGFGISAPALGYDDYEGLDVAGRLVVAFDRTPADAKGRDPLAAAPDELGSARAKALAAHARGARALLLVAPAGDRRLPAIAPGTPSVKSRQVHLRSLVLPLPVARISGEVAEALLKGSGRRTTSLDALHSALADRAAGGTPRRDLPTSFLVDERRATVSVRIARSPLAASNVVGRHEGADPLLRDEFVIVGAHFDHDGIDAEGLVYNGADDNASGTAGVLEVAEAFGRLAEDGLRPRRSIVFALWNGEEHGMLGSQAFADETVANGRRPAAVLNLDMIGRDEHVPEGDQRFAGLPPTPASRNRNALHVLGYTHSPGLMALTREENRATRLALRTTLDDNPQRLLRRSDQWPFLRSGVPALFFFTGLHPDYHTPEDDVDKLNFEKMVRIVQLVYRVAWRVADAPAPPAYVESPTLIEH